MLRAYKNLLQRHPFFTQAVQTGLLMGTGDVIAQVVVEKRPKLDLRRSATFTAIGFCFLGPSLRLWYGVLERAFGAGRQPAATLKKVALDQFVFAPTLIASLLTVVPLANGHTWGDATDKLSNDYWTVLKANYVLWPWVQIGNFYFVPLQYQVLVVQVVALFWNVYVSWKANAPLAKKTKV
ncbi:protein Mpv17-like [Neocloeon triangulifer]|uniref:protein Mpv17-like n=1 Tax=Neocloeon triangulifer TaxID=2078957 RepID=UPI00286EFB7B|nr:protein Mpv17-like [Neocloeon triangulifer]